MKNFYWIDSFQGYPDTMDKLISMSIETYQTLYPRYTEALGYCFRFLHLEDIDLAYGSDDIVHHREFGNILASEGAAYVGLVHPDLQRERKQELLYCMIARSKNVRLLNHSPKFPMVCKDKFLGTGIAREVGLRVLPTALICAEATAPQLDFIEHTVGSYPMFIRPRDLTAGLGKRTINDREALQRYTQRPPFPGRPLIAQPCISVEAEYRVYLGRRDVVACRRREPLREGRLTVAPDALVKHSSALSDYLGTSYLCVDWLWDGFNYWFCEFELGGGFGELSEPHRDRVGKAFFQNLAATSAQVLL